MSGELAVEVRGLGFTYPGSRRRSPRAALVDLAFDVESGCILGILGPNGGGKSTLFKILATLLRHQAGTVKVLGVELPAGAAALRRELGVVFQAPSLDPHLTVQENLTTQGRLYGLGSELATRVQHQLARFALGDRAGDYVRTLSGGLARRVEIAKALVHKPRLLLLDEPSSGLDPRARLEFWGQLEALSDEGVTVLLTTHFTEEADRCDQLALIDEGRLVVVGEPAQLKSAVSGDVVTVIASDASDAVELAGEVHALTGVTAKVHRDQLRFEYHGAASLLGRLAEAFPGRVESMSVAKPTLEDVFIAHTGHGLAMEEA